MAKNIFQKVTFPTTPERLYNLYLSAKEHGAATGGDVRIEKKVGSAFKAFGGMLSGKILHLIPGRMIVQTWRSAKFYKSDPDSILILSFSKARGGAQLELSHLQVPNQDYVGVKTGWPAYYWKPWAQYLKKK